MSAGQPGASEFLVMCKESRTVTHRYLKSEFATQIFILNQNFNLIAAGTYLPDFGYCRHLKSSVLHEQSVLPIFAKGNLTCLTLLLDVVRD